MTTIATNVQWSSESPRISFDFSYEKKREGSTQYYAITVSCRPLLTAESFYGYPINVQIFLDGVEKTSFNLKGASPQYWSSAISHATGWLEVANKTSGTTAIAIRVYSGSYSTRDVTYQYQLDVDPAASKISCTQANIGSNPTISITRSSTNFTHTVQYQPANYKQGDPYVTIAEKTSATTITSWTIPDSFYDKIPNDTRTNVWLRCITYNGNTEVGTSNCMFVATADESKCKPTVVGTVVDTNPATIAVTGNSGILVRYCSTAMCYLDATLNKGAGSFTVKTVNNIPLQYANINIPNVGVSTFDFYAKDSRGFFNSDKVVCTLIPYIPLTNDATIQRDDPTSGKATLRVSGNYFNGSFGATNNSLTIQYKQGDGSYVPVTPTISGNKYEATVALSGLDYTKSFNFEIVVSDKLNTAPKPLTLQKGFPVFDWGENDFNFNVPVTINGVNILEKLAELERRIS